MLLIAIPKSASTSLMWSVSEMGKIRHKNGQNRRYGDVKCQGYEELQKYHGTTVKRTKKYIYDFAKSSNLIYKEHILPTKEHLEILSNMPYNFVVLLRYPQGVIESYERVFKVLPEIKIDMKKLKAELEEFCDKYKNFDCKKMLIVTYEELMLNFHVTIEKVLRHYGLGVPSDLYKWRLAERNCTKDGLKKLLEKK